MEYRGGVDALKDKLIPADKLAKMRQCAPLLPDPGPEVVAELFGHIDAVTAERDEWKRRAGAHGCNVSDADGDVDCG
jgi:hypothetical protein